MYQLSYKSVFSTFNNWFLLFKYIKNILYIKKKKKCCLKYSKLLNYKKIYDSVKKKKNL